MDLGLLNAILEDRNFLSCSGCDVTADKPRILPCLHSVCAKCCEDDNQIKDDEDRPGQCPKCNEGQATMLKKAQPEKNHFLVSMYLISILTQN